MSETCRRSLFGSVSALALAFVLAAVASIGAQRSSDIRITPLSNPRADMVSGGDVLVRIDTPADATAGSLRVTLNGADITDRFRPDPNGAGLVGLVSGLRLGDNALAVARGGTGAGKTTLRNFPISGPIFAGAHEEPFLCETDKFKLRSGETLGPPLDENCTVKRRVDYLYRSTEGGTMKPLPSPSERPADLGHVTTSTGVEVPYVVRVETGTINRAIYQIAVLQDPVTEKEPDPWTSPKAWNRRLIYTFGGGCMYGWYRQGFTTGGVEDDVMLRQGYAVASSSLNVFGNNCNDLLAAETMMMVKERVVEMLGQPKFTIGWGCSGGSYQNHQIADNYPGLLDGIIPGCSFPDVIVGMIPYLSDSRSFNNYFSSLAGLPWTDDQKKAAIGFVKLGTMVNNDKQYAGRIAVTELCPEVVPEAMRYHPTKNRKGVRCGTFDHTVNVLGRDPSTGFARRPMDNVGVQYGLKALNSGKISKEQFLDLNEKIGGYDNDGNISPKRTTADLLATRVAYRTGRITYAGAGLATIPIIDYRAYADDLEPDGDVHVRYFSYSMRERLLRVNGYADNHVMLTEDRRYGGYSTRSPVLREALSQMDRWLTQLKDDTSNDPQIDKVRRAKPADLVDACWTRDANPQKIVEKATRSGRCEELYPSASFPREVAGGSIATDIVKCQLKPIQAADYQVTFTSDEMTRLRRMFPAGVCDWSKPGVEQQKLAGTWLRFGPTPGLFATTD